MIKITNEFLQENKTARGGYTAAQLVALGLNYSDLKKGWKSDVIGKEITEENARIFIMGKCSHKGKSKNQKCEYTALGAAFKIVTSMFHKLSKSQRDLLKNKLIESEK